VSRSPPSSDLREIVREARVLGLRVLSHTVPANRISAGHWTPFRTAHPSILVLVGLLMLALRCRAHHHDQPLHEPSRQTGAGAGTGVSSSVSAVLGLIIVAAIASVIRFVLGGVHLHAPPASLARGRPPAFDSPRVGSRVRPGR
jgi:hypothetical protein